MKQIIHYLKVYFVEVDKRILGLSSIFISLAIFINYYYGVNDSISKLGEIQQFIGWYLIFIIAFSVGYLLLISFNDKNPFKEYRFVTLFLIAPAIFAWKMAFTPQLYFSHNEVENAYWTHVFYWPFKVCIITVVLFLIWKFTERNLPFYGLTTDNLQLRPYFLMLLIMVPLVVGASTQPDFQAVYPKFQNISYLLGANKEWYKVLYELSYGSDFFSIELFFRGFLVLAFAKWVGKDAILPMALFYCTIHFGKPLGECISSFFGGLILGVVVYQTRTIWGGLLVHLGIAWLMEFAGYFASLYNLTPTLS